MADQVRISAKALGDVAMPGFCPRCFWLKLRLKQMPFQIFPGIFSSIDSYSKRIIHSWFDRYHQPPAWLSGLGALAGYVDPPHYSKFKIVNDEYNILLTGSPDGVFVREDGSHIIVDYKTSRHTKNQRSSCSASRAGRELPVQMLRRMWIADRNLFDSRPLRP